MNPEYIRSKQDKNRVRREYLNNLRLEASNIQQSTNAVKIMDETGVGIPLPSDMRSLDEKRADSERLKIELRKRLGEIMDGENANEAAQEIGSNPDFLFEVMQAINVLIDTFKARYSLGAPADVFVRFATRFVESEAEKTMRDNNFDTNNGRMPPRDNERRRDDDTDTMDDDDDNTDDIPPRDPNMRFFPFENIKQEKKDEEKDADMDQDDTDDDTLLDLIVLPNRNMDMNELPSLNDTETDKKSQKSKPAKVSRVRKPTLKKTKVKKEKVQAAGGPATDTEDEVSIQAPARGQKRTSTETEAESSKKARGKPSVVTRSRQKRLAEEQDVDVSKRPRLDISAKEDTQSNTFKKNELLRFLRYLSTADGEGAINDAQGRQYRIKDIEKMSAGPRGKLIPSLYDIHKQSISTMPGKTKGTGVGKKKPVGLAQESKIEKFKRDLEQGKIKKKPKNVIFGSGLAKVHKQVVEIDQTDALKPSETYVPFGRFILNKHRLNNGVMMMRYAKGGAIKTIPTQKVKKSFVEVMKTILSKKNPSYDQIDKLDNDERNQLHNILQLARLDDQFSVPMPSDIDKDNNRFEILRGQIIAGNDNPDLIKDFKFLLMKLMTNGRIPRREGHDILSDLASLGY